MINYETILSNYEDKLTLMQWLDKVDKALHDATATGFHVNKTGTSTLTFSIDFDDGTTLTSEPVVINQGESVASAAINNGVLTLTLTNGQVLSAGNIFNGNLSLNGDLHVTGDLSVSGETTLNDNLSVSGVLSAVNLNATGDLSVSGDLNCTYIDVSGDIDCGDDLMVAGDAAIVGNATASTFTAPSVIATGTGLKTDVISNINGDIDVFANEVDFNGKIQAQGDIETFGDIKTDYLNSDSAEISAKKPVVEDMTGYSFSAPSTSNITSEIVYAGIVKNGNKLTFAVAINLTRTANGAPSYISLGDFYIPLEIANKIYPSDIGGINFVDVKKVNMLDSFIGNTEIVAYTQKFTPQRLGLSSYVGDTDNVMALNQKYYVRYECTILLSENLAA